jgi:hypothetical protein
MNENANSLLDIIYVYTHLVQYINILLSFNNYTLLLSQKFRFARRLWFWIIFGNKGTWSKFSLKSDISAVYSSIHYSTANQSQEFCTASYLRSINTCQRPLFYHGAVDYQWSMSSLIIREICLLVIRNQGPAYVERGPHVTLPSLVWSVFSSGMSYQDENFSTWSRAHTGLRGHGWGGYVTLRMGTTRSV